MKVAIVCDWLTNVGGAEKVLLEIHRLFPKAPIYTSKYSPNGISWFADADVRTGWLQIFPTCLRRLLGPLRLRWFSRLDLSEYDLVISVTGAEAKAVRASKPGAKHISYCHVPTQYYWQMYDEYVKNPGFGILNPIVRFFFKCLVGSQRKKDFEAAQRVDEFVTISNYAKELIAKYYHREATVIHPPVEVKSFQRGVALRQKMRCSVDVPLSTSSSAAPSSSRSIHAENFSDYYITTSRQVNWKRLDLAVKACMRLKRELLVVGEGPEHGRLVKMAGNSEFVKFLPLQNREELASLLAGAKGYIFPSLEPFGIAPVEALAAGTPVIAFGEGGALDYINDGKNGVLFKKQTVSSVVEAVENFEKMKFDYAKISESARGFSVERFDREIKEFVDEKTV
ncbi:glycosyltransferase [Candidatus Saccharibacteria bacterium]|nr:glycosyltransferase [Candidatus Saccharibacteria bacterium]